MAVYLLPPEILDYIIRNYCFEYIPAICPVSKFWYNVGVNLQHANVLSITKSHKRDTRNRKVTTIPKCDAVELQHSKAFVLQLADLVLRHHTSLLQWVLQLRLLSLATTTAMCSKMKTLMSGQTFQNLAGIAVKHGHMDVLILLHEYARCQDDKIGAVEANSRLNTSTIWNHAFIEAAARGQLDIAQLCKRWGAVNVDGAMIASAKYGHENIVEISYAEWGATSLNKAMQQAAERGHLSIFLLCEKLGASDYNSAMVSAAAGGHLNIVQYCHNQGAFANDTAMISSAQMGHTEIVQLCRQWGANDFNTAIVQAASRGHVRIVCLCKDWGATDIFGAMSIAARGGHIEVVKLCREWLGNMDVADINEILIDAAIGGYPNIAKLSKKWGATNYRDALIEAACAGNANIMRLCRKWGQHTQFDWPMKCAATHGHSHIVSLCKKWGATDYFGAMLKATASGHVDIVRQCYLWCSPIMTEREYRELYYTAKNYNHRNIMTLCTKWMQKDRQQKQSR